ESLGQAFVAARLTREPAEVFALFSPYLTARVNEKKKPRDPAWARREAIIEQLMRGRKRWREESDAEGSSVSTDLDQRWLDLAVRLGRPELVQALAVPGHAGACGFLTTLFRQGLGRAGKEHELGEVLETMIRVGHPGATDTFMELIKEFAR